MAFEMKEWLDQHVVPLTQSDPPLRIYSFLWNGDPPKEILVWLLAGLPAPLAPTGDFDETDCPDKPDIPATGLPEAGADFDVTAWARAAKHVVDAGFRFDHTREQQMVQVEGGLVPVFGGDGAPLFGKGGLASLRLFRKMDDDIALIVQIACQFPGSDALSAGQQAAAACKEFYALFNESPLDVIRVHGAVFGQA